MSSAGLWPTLARRCLLSQDDWALSPVRTFSKPKTAPGHRPFPARHTIPFQVWRRFPQAADSATDWQALLRWRRWLAWLPRRPNSITARRAAAARSSGPHHAAAGESRTRIRRLGSTGGWTVVGRSVCLAPTEVRPGTLTVTTITASDRPSAAAGPSAGCDLFRPPASRSEAIGELQPPHRRPGLPPRHIVPAPFKFHDKRPCRCCRCCCQC